MKREFIVQTPLGQLKARAKYETDSPNSYPGVYVELIPYGGNDEDAVMLACVEYESQDGNLQTCVYQPGVDDPDAIVVHEVDQSGNYICTITETLKRTVVIRADSESEAEVALSRLYAQEKIVLSADDYTETDFSCKKAAEGQDLTSHSHYTADECFEEAGQE